MLTTVFFDIDDTLFDHHGMMQRALEQLYHRTTALQQVPLSHLQDRHEVLLEEVHQRFVVPGVFTLDQARAHRFDLLLQECGTTDPGLAVQLQQQYRLLSLQQRALIPGARALLEHLSPRFQLGVISNNSLQEQLDKLQQLEIFDLIQVWVVSSEFGFGKPDPRIYQLALQRAGCTASQALMVGDSWQNDVEAARNAGLQAVWFNRFQRPVPDPEVPAVTRLEHLLPWPF